MAPLSDEELLDYFGGGLHLADLTQAGKAFALATYGDFAAWASDQVAYETSCVWLDSRWAGWLATGGPTRPVEDRDAAGYLDAISTAPVAIRVSALELPAEHAFPDLEGSLQSLLGDGAATESFQFNEWASGTFRGLFRRVVDTSRVSVATSSGEAGAILFAAGSDDGQAMASVCTDRRFWGVKIAFHEQREGRMVFWRATLQTDHGALVASSGAYTFVVDAPMALLDTFAGDAVIRLHSLGS